MPLSFTLKSYALRQKSFLYVHYIYKKKKKKKKKTKTKKKNLCAYQL